MHTFGLFPLAFSTIIHTPEQPTGDSTSHSKMIPLILISNQETGPMNMTTGQSNEGSLSTDNPVSQVCQVNN